MKTVKDLYTLVGTVTGGRIAFIDNPGKVCNRKTTKLLISADVDVKFRIISSNDVETTFNLSKCMHHM